jgi:hypothetical protein
MPAGAGQSVMWGHDLISPEIGIVSPHYQMVTLELSMVSL